MNKASIKKEIDQLREELTKADALYEKHIPELLDKQYDEKYFKLMDLEIKNPEFYDPESPTQKINYEMVEGLEKVSHKTPLLSLDKTNKSEGIDKFCDKLDDEIIREDKFDGLTIELDYENGALVDAVTRGRDGIIGERVLHTVKTIRSVPKKINFKKKLRLRGEGLSYFEDFDRININGEFSNTRNFASGTIRQLDAKVAAERNLYVQVYDILEIEGISFEKDSEQLDFLKELGFLAAKYKVYKNTPEDRKQLIEDIHHYEKVERGKLPYAIDGIVLKFNNIKLRETLGNTAKFPRWGIAFKFESLDAITTLRKIIWQVGRTGRVTPVFIYDEVNIGGSNFKRATGDNIDVIIKLGLKIGDKILVARSKDVIPKVIKCLPELRKGDEVDIKIPDICPICGGLLERDGAYLYCTALDCTAQQVERIIHFADKGAVGIEGLGDSSVQLFYSKELLKNMSDIYKLKDLKDKLIELDKFGEKKIENMLSAIEDSKKQPLSNVMCGLSILHFGKTNSKLIAREFKSMDNIIEASKNRESFAKKIININGVGDVMTDSIINFFENPSNLEVINQLKASGLTMVEPNEEVGNILEGKNFVITGTLSKGRDEFKKIIEQNGGKAIGGVSKKTDYLLEGENAGSKHDKAIELNVKIINEEEFNGLLGK